MPCGRASCRECWTSYAHSGRSMAKRSPDPTLFDYIAGLDLPLVELPKGSPCFRIHRTTHDPLWFGPDTEAPVAGRFNLGHIFDRYGVGLDP